MQFQWCTECSNIEQAAVAQPCKNSCGRRLLKLCVPLMKKYGQQESYIQGLRDTLEKMEKRDMTFRDYQEKKQQLRQIEMEIEVDTPL